MDADTSEPTPEPAPRRGFLARLAIAGCLTVGFVTVALSVVGHFGAWDWRADLFAHFRVQFFTILFVLTGIAFALRSWLIFAVTGAGSVLNALGVLSVLLAQTPPGVEGPELRIYSHNVYTSNDKHAELAAAVRTDDPDVFCAQELDGIWTEALKAEGLGALRPQVLIPRDDNFGIGVWIKERVGLVVREALEIDLGETGLPAIFVKLEVDGRPFEFVTLHTLPTQTALYGDVRTRQLTAAAELAHGSSVPWALVGDLNTTPWSVHFNVLRELGGLADPVTGIGGTWPAGLPAFTRIPIDHCLVRGPLSVVATRYGESAGSDHRPLLVTLRVGR